MTRSPAVARKYMYLLQPIHFLLQYWPSKIFKVNDFHVICDFLLVINSNLDPVARPYLAVFLRYSQFYAENAHFIKNLLFNPKYENVPLAPDCWNFACLGSKHVANYSCKQFVHKTLRLATVHPYQTDGRTICSTAVYRWQIYTIMNA